MILLGEPLLDVLPVDVVLGGDGAEIAPAAGVVVVAVDGLLPQFQVVAVAVGVAIVAVDGRDRGRTVVAGHGGGLWLCPVGAARRGRGQGGAVRSPRARS